MMDPPVAAEVETKSQKTDETKDTPKSYDCGLCDTEVVYKIAQELLPGLASACVDNTTGGIFKSAGAVAADMRKEMADYLTQRSESYVAEFLLAENASGAEVSEHPYDIIISLIDDYAASKRNVFSRVSEWVLSDHREDRIDDFVQEMEINGFWLLPRREYVSSILLKNVDYKNAFHCNMVCSSEEEVGKHRLECKFRPMDCTNEGCTTRYCAAQKEHHEAVCPFMILPCEQNCSDFVMRREMDRHCVTICPMKLVNCAFYTVGCQSSIPRCNVQQHNADDLSSHLLYIIRAAHKEATDEKLKHRVEQILKLSNTEKLARARDARALTYLIKDAEAKLGPLEVETKPETNSGKEEKAAGESSPSNKKESPTKTEPLVKDGSDSDSPPNKKEANDMKSSTERIVESPVKMEDEKKEVSKEEENKDLAAKEKDPIKQEPSHKDQELETARGEKAPEKEDSSKESFSSAEQESKKPPKEEESSKPSFSSAEQESKKPHKEEESSKQSVKKERAEKSSRKREKTGGSDEEKSPLPSDTESWHSDA